MEVRKKRGYSGVEAFSNYLPTKDNSDKVEGISPLAQMDPNLRQALVLEMLLRRMDRLEGQGGQGASRLDASQTQKTPNPSPITNWLGIPANEQDAAPKPKPTLRAAAETYRKTDQLS